MADHSQNVRPELAKESLDVDFSHSATEATLTEAALTKTVDIDIPESSDPVLSTSSDADAGLDCSGFSSDLKESCADLDLNDHGSAADSTVGIPDHYSSLVAPVEMMENREITVPQANVKGAAQTFHYAPISGNNRTILDRLITYIAMALQKLDSLFFGRASNLFDKKRKLRSERENELEEFMNERTKNAIGRKLGAKNKRKQDAEELEEDFQ